MRRLSIAIVSALLLASCSSGVATIHQDKIYVAVEEEGTIAVIDAKTNTVIRSIDLSSTVDEQRHIYLPHNVQVSPDGSVVWVTANHSNKDAPHGHSFIPVAYACETLKADDAVSSSKNSIEPCNDENVSDQVMVIDALTDRIIKRIDIAPMAHLAHIVISPDGRLAYATAQQKGVVVIDTSTFSITDTVQAPKASEPHGLRMSPQGTKAYIALLGANALAVLDTATHELTTISLPGKPVQTAVTSDGSKVLASLFDTKSIAVYDVQSKSLTTVKLPANAKGPVQLIIAPDDSSAFIADQGVYFGQPVGSNVYVLDLRALSISSTIKAGDAPHGTALSPNGSFLYVTNLNGGDVSVIDTKTNARIATIAVGKAPNGISYWSIPQ